jgi:hypothetical protein
MVAAATLSADLTTTAALLVVGVVVSLLSAMALAPVAARHVAAGAVTTPSLRRRGSTR